MWEALISTVSTGTGGAATVGAGAVNPLAGMDPYVAVEQVN